MPMKKITGTKDKMIGVITYEHAYPITKAASTPILMHKANRDPKAPRTLRNCEMIKKIY